MDRDNRRNWLPVTACPVALAVMATTLVGIVVVGPARGAPPAGRSFVADADDRDQTSDDATVWAERSVLQRLRLGRELMRQERYAEAVRYLGSILEDAQDYFIQPDPRSRVDHSLKAEANRLIGQMPPAGRDSYELQYGARARKTLSEAVAAGNASGLAEVSRQFFHTKAGYQATLLLGLDDLDHGRPLAGALTLRRLRDVGPAADQFEPLLSLTMATCWLQAGMKNEAQQALVALKVQRSGTALGFGQARTLNVGGRDVPIFQADADAVPWLARLVGQGLVLASAANDSWLMFQGDPARTGIVEGDMPLLSLRWRVPPTDDPRVEEFLQSRYQGRRDQGVAEACCLFPLVVGDVVLMRDMHTLWAVDFNTGKRLWNIPFDNRIDTLAENPTIDPFGRPAPQLGAGIEQRMWLDFIYGALSSDGRCVFSIEDLGWGVNLAAARRIIIGGRNQADPAESRSVNRLAATNVRTGKIKWDVGGPANEYALRLADTFFLGAPLPLAGRLYVLAETREEIRLIALDAETGDPLWSQQLGMVEQNVQLDPYRRFSGISPSYADGVLVCPTASGAIIGVELATRSLLWRYRYGRSRDSMMEQGFPNRRFGLPRGEDGAGQWNDANAVIYRGHVIVGPEESNDLHCLKLVDGTLEWKRPRQDDLYLACVEGEQVVLAGQHRLKSLRLDNGLAEWTSSVGVYPDNAVPSGRGFQNGSVYFMPLSTAQIAAFDLASGKIESTARSRDGLVPGNLVSCRGRILSQNADGLASYYRVAALDNEVSARLSAHPDDAEALALRGELLLDRDKQDAAIDALRRSYRQAPELRTRDLLREALMDGLRRDFARYQDAAAELEQLLDDGQQRTAYLRLMAAGLQQSGHWRDALQRYRAMIQADHGGEQMETVDVSLSVRPSRWIQSKLDSLRQSAGPEDLAEIDRFIAAQWKTASDQGTAAALRQFLDYFGSHPSAVAARRLLIEQLIGAGRFLEAELLLWGQPQGSDNRRPSGAALVQLADVLRKADRLDDAARVYNLLSSDYAGVAVRGETTGRQVVAGLADDDPVRRRLNVEDRWPKGKVEWARKNVQRVRPASYGALSIEFQQGQDPFFTDATLVFDHGRGTLSCRDGLGSVRWLLSLSEPNHMNPYGINQTGATAAARGHLLVLLLDGRLLAVDTLARSSAGGPRILWSKDLSETAPLRTAGNRLRPGLAMNLAWGIDPYHGGYQTTCALGPVTEDFVCYQRGRDCVAVDPASGEPLWIRHDMPQFHHDAQSVRSFFGDDRYVFLRPADKPEALVLDARNGSLLGQRKLPAGDDCLAQVGRKLLVLRSRLSGFSLELFDPWQEKAVWTSPRFTNAAKFATAGNQAVGVFEPDGRFRMFSLTDGQPLCDSQLKAEPALEGIHVLPSGQQYILVVLRSVSGRHGQFDAVQPLPGTVQKPVGNGLVYALDRQGKQLWPQPQKVENQQLIADAPAQVPVVVFACQVYRPQQINGMQIGSSILCIDKRTGRVVYRDRLMYPSQTFEVSGQPDKHTVEIALGSHPMRQSTVVLTFTDQPAPPEPPAEKDDSAENDDSSSAPPGNLLDAIIKALKNKNLRPGGAVPAAKPQASPPSQPTPEKLPPRMIVPPAAQSPPAQSPPAKQAKPQ